MQKTLKQTGQTGRQRSLRGFGELFGHSLYNEVFMSKQYNASDRPRKESPAAESEKDNVICGRNAVRELLKSGKPVDKILVRKGGEREGSITLIVAEAIAAKIPVIEADRRKLDEYGENNQGVCAIIPEREYASLEDIYAKAESKGQQPFIVIADHINDPHNLGAVIRSACCAGAHGVIIPKRNCATLNATAVKASAGASEYVPVCRVPNIASVIEELKKKNIWVYCAEADGSDLYSCDFGGGIAIVLGSEGGGVSRVVRERSDFCVSVPMYGQINSLNVSAAAAVILFEAAKQRNIKA